MTGTMPEFISVNDYISEVKDDISSPPTSNFVSKMPLCRQTVNELEEVRTYIFPIFYCECPGQANTSREFFIGVNNSEQRSKCTAVSVKVLQCENRQVAEKGSSIHALALLCLELAARVSNAEHYIDIIYILMTRPTKGHIPEAWLWCGGRERRCNLSFNINERILRTC